MSEKTNEELANSVIQARNRGRYDMTGSADERLWHSLTEAAARLRQQSEDSARFDFLEQLKDGQINYNGVQWVLSIPDQEPPYLWSYPSGKTLRAAIDKARKA